MRGTRRGSWADARPSSPSCSASAGPRPTGVLPNAATRRWLGTDQRTPLGIRVINRISGPLGRLPQPGSPPPQRVGLPLLTPYSVTEDRPDSQVEAGALYAGETVARINDIRAAGPLTRELGLA